MYIFTFFICKYCIHVIIDPDRRNLSYLTDRLASRFVSSRLDTIHIPSTDDKDDAPSREAGRAGTFERSYYADFNWKARVTSCISAGHFHFSKSSKSQPRRVRSAWKSRDSQRGNSFERSRFYGDANGGRAEEYQVKNRVGTISSSSFGTTNAVADLHSQPFSLS